MSKKALSDLFQRWVNRGRRLNISPRSGASPLRTRLRVEEVEERLAPATLPAVTATGTHSVVAGFQPQVVADPNNPNNLVMVVTNGTSLTALASTDGGGTFTQFLTTSGTSYGANANPNANLLDPTVPQVAPLPPYGQFTTVTSPSVTLGRDGIGYITALESNTAKTSGAVVLYSFNFNNGSPTVIDLDPNDSYNYGPLSPFHTSFGMVPNNAQVIYRWTGQDPALNPTVAVDTNLASYTDPDTNATVTDSMITGTGASKAVYIAWNTNATAATPTGPGGPAFNPNAILTVASSDAGLHFTTPVLVNNNGYTSFGPGYGAVQPQILFTPMSLNSIAPGGTTATGTITFTWSSTDGAVVTDSSRPDGGNSAQQAATSSGEVRGRFLNSFGNTIAGPIGIVDAVSPPAPPPPAAPPPDTPNRTDVAVSVNLAPAGGNLAATDVLSDLDVTLGMVHPNMSQVQVILTAPNGDYVVLVNNRINSAGTANANLGIAGANLGGNPNAAGTLIGVGTTFNDEAPRSIHDPANAAPFTYPVQAEGGFFPGGVGAPSGLPGSAPTPGSGNSYATLAGLYSGHTASQLSGTWVLTIIDYRHDAAVPTQNVQFVNFHASAYITNGHGAGRFGTDQLALPAGTTISAGADQATALKPAASPTTGLGASYSVAYDTSLGSFSPYAGRLYLAYTGPGAVGTDTNIFVTYSDNGGQTWSTPVQVNDDAITDNYSEGNRQQFNPTITVDPATGTVVVMWYDARNDASNVRVSQYMATSIDGGKTWSPNTYLNATKTATDEVTHTVVNLEPIPDNIPVMGGFGEGLRQSVVAYGGQIKPFWTGNANAGGQSIYTATVRTAAGPRIISTDMGAVTADAPGGYNNTFTLDGTRQIDGFTVTFDRLVKIAANPTIPDPLGFDISDVVVQYLAATSQRSANAPPTQIPVVNIHPLDPQSVHAGLPIDSATQFYIQFATPQSAAGTYSWAVGPNISDRIRSTTTAVYHSSDTPAPIPDNSVLQSQITIPAIAGNPLVQSLQVGLNIQHPYTPDLRITLIGPDGTTKVVLSDENGYTTYPPPAGLPVLPANYTNTIFSDTAAQRISNPAVNAPFTGQFRPQSGEFLSNLTGQTISGTWTLRVEDLTPGNIGKLLNWSLQFTGAGGATLKFNSNGNLMDQNANGQAGEAQADVFTNPRSLSGKTFDISQGLDPNTLPLIATGPHLVSSSVPNDPNPADTDNEVLNASATYIDLTFDRELNPASFTPANIIQITGPAGVVSLPPGSVTVAPVPGSIDANTGGSKTFRVSFPAQSLSGAYTIEFNPGTAGNLLRAVDRFQLVKNLPTATNAIPVTFSQPVTGFAVSDILRITGPNGAVNLGLIGSVSGSGASWTINFSSNLPAGQYVVDFKDPTQTARNLQVANSGPAIDMNFNAGLDVLRGTDPNNKTVQSQTFTSTGTVAIAPASSSTNSVTPSITDLPIQVNQDFLITQSALNQIQLLLNISYPNARDLDIQLIPPGVGATPIQLYTGSLASTSNSNATANFTNTLLSDRTGTPNVQSVLSAQPPYFAGAGKAFAPQTPLSTLVGIGSLGTWTLRVINHGTVLTTTDPNYNATTGPAILGWSLTLPQSIPGTGMGEAVADRFSASFRIFNQDPSNPLTQQAWSPVGPAPTNETANAARISATAVDPSDPTGNTAYLSVAGGGIWKTTDFLTTDPAGPHYVPLTDFGPTLAVNVSSIALFPRNGDPNQTIVYALTGEADELVRKNNKFTAQGVGVLRSMDGGKTWAVLDSKDNTIPLSGRAHDFVGSTGFKIVVDPNLSPNGQVIVYMALTGGTNPGIWRSLDGGDHWQLVRAGNATDVVLAAGSANPTDAAGNTVSNGNLQRLFAAFQGQGVFGTNSAPSAVSLNPLNGGAGSPLIRLYNPTTQTIGNALPVNAPAGTPTGAKGRITLAAPALTGNPRQDFFLKDWLYALVVGTNNAMDGLYVTKDNGQNWTKVQLPYAVDPITGLPYGTNDTSKADYDIFTDSTPPAASQGDYDIAMSVSPLNPNIVYIGGYGDNLLRVDLTKLRGPQSYVFGSNSDPGLPANGTVQTGGVSGGPGAVVQGGTTGTLYNTDFLNLSRDYNNPFDTNSVIRVTGGTAFINDGAGASWSFFTDSGILTTSNLPDATQAQTVPTQLKDRAQNRFGFGNIHNITTFVDPLTGQMRMIVGTDNGLSTGVDDGTGKLSTGIGFQTSVAYNRNGNLQVAQFNDGAVQPSQFAADLAGALFYGMADKNGFPVSSGDILSTGNLNWRGPLGDGVAVSTDPTGSGTAYQWRAGYSPGYDLNVNASPFDFFRVLAAGTDQAFGGGNGRSTGLIIGADNPGTGTGQWPMITGYPFAVNPLNGNVLMIASGNPLGTPPVAGAVYRSIDQGVSWTTVAAPGTFAGGINGSIAQALAFGSADPTQPTLTNNFLYAGTAGGKIYVSNTGGSAWSDISTGLDTSPVLQIIPDPQVGKRDVYAITATGVFYKADGLNVATSWTNITKSLFGTTRAAFGDVNQTDVTLKFLTSMAIDWRYATPFPNDPTRTYPVIYVGGEGGVFQTKDFGQTWTLFPAASGTIPDGGNLPNTHITALDLSIGALDPTTGKYQPGGLNMLTATTYGRGMWAIRLDPNLPANSFISGPRVDRIANLNPVGGPSTQLDVWFTGAVDPATFTSADVQLLDPSGASITITSVTEVPDMVGGVDRYDHYRIAFASQNTAGSYTLTVGYNPTGGNVPAISDFSGFLMNQNGNTTNGEAGVDQYVTVLSLNSANADHLSVTSFQSPVTAGVPTSVTVQALRADGTVDTSVNGTLTLTSFAGAITPTTATMTNGVATFNVTFQNAGTQTVNVSAPGIDPTSWTANVLASAATGFRFDQPAYVVNNPPASVNFTLTAVDAFGNQANYNGPVTITSTGIPGNLPTTVNVVNGQVTFSGIFATRGSAQITASGPNPANPSGPAFTATTTVSVNPGPVARLVVTTAPGPFTAGSPIPVTVQALDAAGNLTNAADGQSVTVTLAPGVTFTTSGSTVLVNGTASFTVSIPSAGSYTLSTTAAGFTGSVGPIAVNPVPLPPSPTQKLTGVFAVGSGTSGSPVLQVYDGSGAMTATYVPFPAGYLNQVSPMSDGFTGGLRVAVGDVTGDNIPDYIVGTGPGITASVVVIDGATGQVVLNYQPFESFTGGVFVAVGDINKDGISDIVITPDEGGGPRVVVLSGGSFNRIANFYGIDDPNFRGGARAGVGDLNGDGYADLVISAGFGGGPRVSIIDGAALSAGRIYHPFPDFFMFDPGLRNGAYITIGDLNGDGFGDIIGGAGPGGGPRILALSGSLIYSQGPAVAMTAPLANFYAGDPNNRGGIRVAAKNLDNDRLTDLIVGSGDTGGSRVSAYLGKDLMVGNDSPVYSFDAFPGYMGGVFVG